MYLPPSEHLAIDTLSGIFSDMSESYKIFWFNSILQGINNGQQVQFFDKIINRMVVDAWYMVTEYHLNLGPADGLEKLVHTVQTETGLPSNARERDILLALEGTTNKEIINLKKRLTLFVPYRLQAPFMKDVQGILWEKRALLCERINNDTKYHYIKKERKKILLIFEKRSSVNEITFIRISRFFSDSFFSSQLPCTLSRHRSHFS
ncbi:MAG: hypothetical protein IKX76_02000 [Eubacterium sp.]|nr:hypothetical protein [Eubacterium sp.]